MLHLIYRFTFHTIFRFPSWALPGRPSPGNLRPCRARLYSRTPAWRTRGSVWRCTLRQRPAHYGAIMSSRAGVIVVAALGAAAALRRARSFALLPQVFRLRKHGGTLPNARPGTTRTFFVVGCLWCFDKLVGRMLLRVGSTLPSSIVSMLLSVGALSGIQIVNGGDVADRIVAQLEPGTAFLGKYLLAFLTAVVAPLPGAIGDLWASSGGTTLLKVLLVHFGGWCFTHASAGIIARAVRIRRSTYQQNAPTFTPPVVVPLDTPATEDALLLMEQEYRRGRQDYRRAVQAAVPSQQPAVAVQRHQSDAWLKLLEQGEQAQVQRDADAHQVAVRGVWTTAACVAYAALPVTGPAPALVCTLQAAILHAQRIPASLGLGPAAPLVISATVTAAACVGLGWLRAETATAAFALYSGRPGAGPWWQSAGPFHVELLSAATFALGFRVFALRELLLTNLRAILTTVTVSASSSLLVTPVVARFVGLAPNLCLMLSQRSVTTPFALAGARALDPDGQISGVLTASVVSIGAMYCALVGLRTLDFLGIDSKTQPVARGLAMGCSSYGVGTGTLLQEGEVEAAGISSAALVLMGVVHGFMCGHAPTVRLLRRLAGAA